MHLENHTLYYRMTCPYCVKVVRFMEAHGITDCAYIGDTQGDYEATLEADVPFIWAAYGFGTPHGYDHKIDSFSDLLILPD